MIKHHLDSQGGFITAAENDFKQGLGEMTVCKLKNNKHLHHQTLSRFRVSSRLEERLFVSY